MQSIPVSQLIISSDNMRQTIDDNFDDYDNTNLDTLAQSIKSQGLLNPILVRPIENGKFEVYAGHRRLMAIKKLQLKTIDCIVTPIEQKDAKMRSLIENYQRKDNTYEEKIRTFANVYYHCCQEDINQLCQVIGCHPQTVKRYLRLNQLSTWILQLIDSNRRLTLKNADLLVDIPTKLCEKLMTEILNSDLSSRESELVIKLFQQNSDVDQIGQYIKQVILESANKRTKNKEDKTKDDKDKNREGGDKDDGSGSGSDVDFDVNDESDEPEKKTKQEKEKTSPDSELQTDKVSKKYPWIYDPSDKKKKAVQIPENYIETVWKLLARLNKGETF